MKSEFKIIPNNIVSLFNGDVELYHIIPSGRHDEYIIVDGGPHFNGETKNVNSDQLKDRFGLVIDLENEKVVDMESAITEDYFEKMGEKCNHEFVGHKECCYCGAMDNGREVITRRVQYNIEQLRIEFSKWYFSIQEQISNPPLAMQIFYWFESRISDSLLKIKSIRDSESDSLMIEEAKKVFGELEVNSPNVEMLELWCSGWKARQASLKPNKITDSEDMVTREEYEHAINEIGQLQEQLKEAEQEIMDLNRTGNDT